MTDRLVKYILCLTANSLFIEDKNWATTDDIPHPS